MFASVWTGSLFTAKFMLIGKWVRVWEHTHSLGFMWIGAFLIRSQWVGGSSPARPRAASIRKQIPGRASCLLDDRALANAISWVVWKPRKGYRYPGRTESVLCPQTRLIELRLTADSFLELTSGGRKDQQRIIKPFGRAFRGSSTLQIESCTTNSRYLPATKILIQLSLLRGGKQISYSDRPCKGDHL